jgi:uncharacterized protein YlxP (DUF503 family)
VNVGVLILDCMIAGSLSLKDKRHVLSSFTERLRRSFNVAVCEVDYQDQWQRTRLAIVLVNTSWRMLQSSMAKIVEFAERDRQLEVLSFETRQLG